MLCWSLLYGNAMDDLCTPVLFLAGRFIHAQHSYSHNSQHVCTAWRWGGRVAVLSTYVAVVALDLRHNRKCYLWKQLLPAPQCLCVEKCEKFCSSVSIAGIMYIAEWRAWLHCCFCGQMWYSLHISDIVVPCERCSALKSVQVDMYLSYHHS